MRDMVESLALTRLAVVECSRIVPAIPAGVPLLGWVATNQEYAVGLWFRLATQTSSASGRREDRRCDRPSSNALVAVVRPSIVGAFSVGLVRSLATLLADTRKQWHTDRRLERSGARSHVGKHCPTCGGRSVRSSSTLRR